MDVCLILNSIFEWYVVPDRVAITQKDYNLKSELMSTLV